MASHLVLRCTTIYHIRMFFLQNGLALKNSILWYVHKPLQHDRIFCCYKMVQTQPPTQNSYKTAPAKPVCMGPASTMSAVEMSKGIRIYIYIHVNIIYIYMYVCISFIYVYYKYVYMYICIYVYYIYARIRRIHICILYINIPSYTFSKKPIYIIIHIM